MDNNNVSSNPTSQGHYFRYPFYQNPNPLVQNPTTQNPNPNASPSFDRFVHGQNPENGLTRPLNQSATPRQYQYPSLDHFVRGLSAENGLISRLNQSPAQGHARYSTTNASHTSFPLQNHEIIDMQSGLERLRIDDLGLSRLNPIALPNLSTDNGFPLPQQWSRSRNIEPNHGNSDRPGYSNSYGSLFDHLGSSINGSAALLSRFNNFDARVRPHNRSIYSSIDELRGRIFLVAKDEQGCRFLQKKVDERNPIDIEMILLEVKDYLHELMRHQSANYLIQKLIGVLNEEQMTKLIRSIVNSQQRLFRICDDSNGSRVIQKLLDASEYPHRQPLTPQQKSLLVSALKNITVALSKSMNGYHVIKRCLQKFPSEYTKVLVEEIAENCIHLATDRSGCCLLQDCIKYAQKEQKGRMITDVVSNVLFLSDHSYGNYVVQYVVTLKIPQVTANVHAQFTGIYFTLSQGKCSSNVVERCLESGEEQSTDIINELIQHQDILELMLHPFGNYVVQRAWSVSKGRRIQQTLHTLVEGNCQVLQSHIYGKRVLAEVRENKNRNSFYKRA